MMNFFFTLFSLVVAQRLIELILAKKHERVMKEAGGHEEGAEHYKWVVTLHIGFFISLFVEVLVKGNEQLAFSLPPLVLFLLAQILRIWTIASLGSHWNTKIIVMPGADLVRKGPYKWIKHPNYLIVAVEIVVFPLIFHAIFTAVLFTLLNAAMMFVRIPAEEAALRSVQAKQD
jgi:methyltransferase